MNILDIALGIFIGGIGIGMCALILAIAYSIYKMTQD